MTTLTPATTRLERFIADQVKANPIEARLIRKIVKALADAGNPVVAVFDGDDKTPAKTIEEIFELVFNLDEAYLVTSTSAWVFVVMGNEWDAISDYNVSLEAALATVNAYVEANW